MNNPAARLHAVLERYEETRADDPNIALEAVWQKTLNLGGVALRVALSRVAGLVPEIAEIGKNFAEEHGDVHTLASVNAHAPAWLKPVVLPPIGSGQAAHTDASIVGEAAMLALGQLSFTLSRLAPEGNDLSAEVRGDMQEQITQLMGDVRADDTLPSGLKDLILRRLHEIADALDAYEFGGPGGIEAACDRLVAALVRNPDHAANSVVKKVWDAAVGIYATLGVAVTLSDSAQLAATTYTQITGKG